MSSLGERAARRVSGMSRLPRPRPRIVWTADNDGQAHAAIGRRIQTPCGLRPLEPRWGRPETQPRCPVCRAAAEEVRPAKRH